MILLGRLALYGAGDANPFEVGLEALRQEAGEQTPHEPVFEVHLNHIRRVGPVRTHRRLERHGADRGRAPPLAGPLAPPSPALPQMHEVLRSSPKSAARILPYVSGEDINNSPNVSGSRFLMYLDDLSEDELSEFPELRQIVINKVKPERDRLGSNPNNRKLKKFWWRFHAARSNFYDLVTIHQIILVSPQLGPHLTFAQQKVGNIWSKTLNLFLFRKFAALCILQSRVHEIWARLFGSTFEDRLRYTPSDCFETFAFPDGFEANATLDVTGQIYHDHRATAMLARHEGMTQIYNRFHDRREKAADICRLRELHADMDRMVLRAYGWDDLAARADPQFLDETNEDDHKYRSRLFWPAEFRDDVLARLLALNAERAATEHENEPLAPRRRAKRTPSVLVGTDLLESSVAHEDD